MSTEGRKLLGGDVDVEKGASSYHDVENPSCHAASAGGGGRAADASFLSEEDAHFLKVIETSMSDQWRFIRKVYTILSIQLLGTFGIVLAGALSDDVRGFMLRSAGMLILAFVVSIVSLLVMMCVPSVQYKSPQNYVFLTIFTAAEGYLIGVISAMYETSSVLQAIGITAAITIGLTIYTFRAGSSFEWMGSILFVLLMVMMVGGFIRLFLPFSPVAETVYACFGAMLFSGFIVYDTAQLLHKMHPHEYVAAAISLYLDIINLFIYILEIFGKRRGD